MQQRRLRPGDVLDDYCPRERRITDHAVVAMIDDNIKQTRCVVCDAEHEYKQGKIPPQRRKKAQSALFTQVLDGLQPSRPPHQPEEPDDPDPLESDGDELDAPSVGAVSGSSNGNHDQHAPPPTLSAPAPHRPAVAAAAPTPPPPSIQSPVATPIIAGAHEGSVRRSLIRATLPRPEGTPPPARTMPDFTIRQPANTRGRGPGGRRRGGGGFQSQAPPGVMRFGRGAHSPRPQGPRGHGNPNGQASGNGQGGPNGNRSGGPRRGGKKR